MTKSLSLLPDRVDVGIARGDTFAFTFVVTDSMGVPVNISGTSFLLTVDPSQVPVDSSGNLFQLVGSIIDGPGGRVEFALSAAQADQAPGEYWYDLQMTEAGLIRTIATGKFTFRQDITK